MSELIRIRAVNTPDTNMPEWKRSVWLDPDSGIVYGPAVMLLDEEAALMQIGMHGGPPILWIEGRLFLPLFWVAHFDPDAARVCNLIAHRVREVMGCVTPF